MKWNLEIKLVPQGHLLDWITFSAKWFREDHETKVVLVFAIFDTIDVNLNNTGYFSGKFVVSRASWPTRWLVLERSYALLRTRTKRDEDSMTMRPTRKKTDHLQYYYKFLPEVSSWWFLEASFWSFCLRSRWMVFQLGQIQIHWRHYLPFPWFKTNSSDSTCPMIPDWTGSLPSHCPVNGHAAWASPARAKVGINFLNLLNQVFSKSWPRIKTTNVLFHRTLLKW